MSDANTKSNQIKKILMYNKDNKIGHEILNYFNIDYNRNYDRNQNLNKEIMSKDQLISINNNTYDLKRNYALVLRNIVFYLIFVFLFVNGYYFKLYSGNVFIGLCIFGLLITIYFTTKRLYWNDFSKGLKKAVDAGEETLKDVGIDVARTILPDYMTRDRCPAKCQPAEELIIGPEEEEYNFGRVREMDTDSTVNTWIKGDQPEATWDMRKTKKEEEENKPQPWYGAVDPEGVPEYTCVWDNITDGGRLATNPRKFKSHIPCDRFPGYITKNEKL